MPPELKGDWPDTPKRPGEHSATPQHLSSVRFQESGSLNLLCENYVNQDFFQFFVKIYALENESY